MKLKATLFGFLFLLGVGKADDMPADNEIVTTYCGVNVLEQTWVDEVCLAHVRGFESLEVLQTSDTKGNVVAAPIVRRTVLKQKNKNTRVEVLQLTAGAAEKNGDRSYLKTYQATYTITRKAAKGEVIERHLIEGRDGNGRPFKANLEGFVHTQIGGE